MYLELLGGRSHVYANDICCCSPDYSHTHVHTHAGTALGQLRLRMHQCNINILHRFCIADWGRAQLVNPLHRNQIKSIAKCLPARQGCHTSRLQPLRCSPQSMLMFLQRARHLHVPYKPNWGSLQQQCATAAAAVAIKATTVPTTTTINS